ncbi:MAG TPA: hypothetical protein VIB00_11970 [Pyrinomonadaceae bacterium]|jgi:hypothetical protein
MLSTKRLLLSFFVVLAIAIWTIPASAQRPQPIGDPMSAFTGFEIASGYNEGDEVYGWLCYGRVAGALSGDFTLTMDYVPAKSLPGSYSPVERGQWTFPVYTRTIRGETYMGVLYGNVIGGGIQWDYLGTTGTMSLKLEITGGTQTLDGLKGEIDFNTEIYRDGSGRPPMKGDLTFHF